MDLLEVMRTTFSCRDFTDDPVTDDQLHRILDAARFAPSGGNRQGSHVVVVRDRAVRQRLGDLCGPTMRLYAAQGAAGEMPFNTVTESTVDVEAAMAGEGSPPTGRRDLFDRLGDVPVVLVVSVDLSVVASMDKDLDRVGVVTGASVYPLVWNILLAARTEGLAGVVTTAVVPAEDEVRTLLGLPGHHAVAAMIPLGVPVRRLTRLSRQAVEEFTTIDRYDGPPLTA
jgi:nitroreductase